MLVATMSKIRDGFDEQYLARNFGGKRLNFLILWVSVKEPLALEQWCRSRWSGKVEADAGISRQKTAGRTNHGIDRL